MAIMPTTAEHVLPPFQRHALAAAVLTSVASLAPSTPAHAAEWRIAPTLDLRETYTDNVRLSSPGTERSDFVTDIAPGIIAIADGPRLKLRAKYALHGLAFANHSDANTLYHELDANANAELVDNLFFIDGQAVVNQQNTSLLGPQPVDNTSITENRSTVKTVSVSPYLRHMFGNTARSELRYSHSTVTSSIGGLASSRINGLSLSLNSGPSFRQLGWGLNHSTRKIDYDDAQTVTNTTTAGNLRYAITPQFYLTATAGYDEYDYVSVGDTPEGRSYSGGFSWLPSERTSISASAGKRFWGNTYSFETRLRSRASVWRVAYNEEITTTQSQFAALATNSTSRFLDQLFLNSIPDPVRRQQAVDRFILSAGLPPSLSRTINYFTNEFFLQKSLQASVALTGARNTVIFSVVNVRRDGQSTLASSDPLAGFNSLRLNADTRQTGASVVWNQRLSPRMDANLSADFNKTRQITTDIRERLKTFRAALSRQLQPNVNGVLELRRQSKSSDLPGSDYTENGIAVLLSIRF